MVTENYYYPDGLNMNNNKHPGRPRLEQTDIRKHRLPGPRVTTIEYSLIRARAKSEGMTVTEYIRDMALNQGNIIERVKPEHLQLLRSLTGMANNLNQLAHHCNTFGYAHDAETYSRSIDELSAIITQYYNLLDDR